jgi:beta-galactosidase
MIQPLNENWHFSKNWQDSFLVGEGESQEVRLPHTNQEIPFNSFDEKICQTLCGYWRELDVPSSLRGKRLFLRFMGAGHQAEVFLNGVKLGEHKSGYTAFSFEITSQVKFGEKNIIAVKLDSRESINQPPFGYVIDYLCYGGLYREVYLDIKEQTFIKDVFFKPKMNGSLEAEVTLDGKVEETASLLMEVFDSNGEKVLSVKDKAASNVLKGKVTNPSLWSVDKPCLYQADVTLINGEKELDSFAALIGFREAIFKADGFYLNGEKLRLRGLDRHQSFPYVGYAAPKSLQAEDARILKEELGLNTVRTSHYPDSQHFIDACDRLGLLVFTEIPGWQHIGDEEWKKIAVENVKEMVLQYRNHPSIILWGVRINESLDDDPFYLETNKAAHELDDTRQTSGVRYLEQSHLLEDVYAHNDFSYAGSGPGLKNKRKATPDMSKGYLVSEYNGHMYPTKTSDDQPHLLNHALRHAAVVDAMYKSSDIAGCIGWCAFDYNTHSDFGSGDKICYHGVMDMFRNPKLAAYVYQAQGAVKPFLALSSSMDKGDYPGGNIKELWAFTNCDSVRLYRGDELISEFKPSVEHFGSLPHPPILIDDFIGDQLVKKEHIRKDDSDKLKKLFKAISQSGLSLSLNTKLLVVFLLATRRFTIDRCSKLYMKYVANWGGSAGAYQFRAVKDGKEVVTVVKAPLEEVHLEVQASSTELKEAETYDMALVRIKALDQNGNLASCFNGPLRLEATGAIELVGPDLISLPGGEFGTLVKSNKKTGKGFLIVSSAQAGDVKIEFNITKEDKTL